jgi:radical SAM protein with 4Fe4S-binding SPASM domain
MNVNSNKTKDEIFQDTIKKNLERKSSFIDEVHLHKGTPLFSWIDLNPTELCNRKCVFCPRVDESEYPNQNLNIDLKLCTKIHDELISIGYKGGIVLSGYGEPMLHPQIMEMVKILGYGIQIEIVTNGDTLNVEIIKEIYNNGLDLMVVSMYDGPHQVKHFEKMFYDAKIPKESFILRDRWYASDVDFGVKLTNRAGVVTIGNQEMVDLKKPCNYPFYSMMVDWNGDVMLCVQDWNKKVKMGNIAMSSLVDVWNSKSYTKYRRNLAKSRRVLSPCKECNTDGTLHGKNHVEKWISIGKYSQS